MINEGRRTRCANSVSRALHIQASTTHPGRCKSCPLTSMENDMSFDEQPDGDPHGECALESDATKFTHEMLRRWGEALDKERPKGLGEALLCYAYDWEQECAELRKENEELCERAKRLLESMNANDQSIMKQSA